ncbi:MAG: metallophosphoesterase [candidate division NC10 bacterium]|nr:metallophosphoesterase [candidate division NC10 bacterium]
MRIGAMADTHDNLPMIRRAVEAFNAEQVELVIHAGDIVAPFALRPLDELICSYLGIFGNNDGDKALLRKRSQGRIGEDPYSLELGERRILVVHDLESINLQAEADRHDLIVYGHTHQVDIQKRERALIVNPGEGGGWLYGRSTIAVIELDDMKAEVIDL